MASTFNVDGYRAGRSGQPATPPDVPVLRAEYLAGYRDGEQARNDREDPTSCDYLGPSKAEIDREYDRHMAEGEAEEIRRHDAALAEDARRYEAEMIADGFVPPPAPLAPGATIRVTYQSIDGLRTTRTFRTLAGAQRFAQHRVGNHPDIGSTYAVSDDGVGKITATGATLADLFPSD